MEKEPSETLKQLYLYNYVIFLVYFVFPNKDLYFYRYSGITGNFIRHQRLFYVADKVTVNLPAMSCYCKVSFTQ